MVGLYDEEDNPLVALEQPRVDALLGHVAGRRVCDLGCGTGRHALRLAARGADVTAVDFSSGMLAAASRKPGWERIRVLEHDLAQPIPLADGTFDVVLSALVLDHVAHVEGLFRECRRLCRPDGCVVASVMHPAMMLRGIVAHFRDPRTGVDVCPASAPNQISDYVLGALRAGLRIVHMSEHAVDDGLADASPRAAKYRGWPMLLLMKLSPH